MQSVLMIRFGDVFGNCEDEKVRQMEAAKLLGIDKRTFQLQCCRFVENGLAEPLNRCR